MGGKLPHLPPPRRPCDKRVVRRELPRISLVFWGIAVVAGVATAGCDQLAALAGRTASSANPAATPAPEASASASPAPSAAKTAAKGAAKPPGPAAKGPACPVIATWSARLASQKLDRAYKAIFYDDGRASWNRASGTFTGAWRVDGTTLIVSDASTDGRPGCGAAEGRYTPQFDASCATMKLVPSADACAERRGFASGAAFTRAP